MRTALVTGGARRIGEAIVKRLAAEGWAVAIHCHRSGYEAKALDRAIQAAGGRAAIIEADLADAAAVSSIIAQAGGALGPVTLLVNNASVFEPDDIGSLDEVVWERHFGVTCGRPSSWPGTSPPSFRRRRRRHHQRDRPARLETDAPLPLLYAVEERSVHGDADHGAGARTSDRVNAVGPGPTLASSRQRRDDFARQGASVPLGQGPNPEEIAEAVLFLATARSVTGQMIAVDGGQHLAWQTPDVLAAAE